MTHARRVHHGEDEDEEEDDEEGQQGAISEEDRGEMDVDEE